MSRRKGSGKTNVALTTVFVNYRINARLRGLVFLLTKEQFYEITAKPCRYCGAEPYRTRKFRDATFTYNGIDRINSEIGYIVENVQPCCTICNKMKSDSSEQDFISHVLKIAAQFLEEESVWERKQ